MNEWILNGFLPRLVYAVCTLYMMLILLAWLGDWIGLDRNGMLMHWAFRLTDPLLRKIRGWMPAYLGPVDLGPLAALLLVYIIRSLAVILIMVPPQHQIHYF